MLLLPSLMANMKYPALTGLAFAAVTVALSLTVRLLGE